MKTFNKLLRVLPIAVIAGLLTGYLWLVYQFGKLLGETAVLLSK